MLFLLWSVAIYSHPVELSSSSFTDFMPSITLVIFLILYWLSWFLFSRSSFWKRLASF